MELVQMGLSNCVVALALALVAVSVGRWCRRPALTHGLWLLVLLKLVTPPLVTVRIPWPEEASPEAVALAVPAPAPDLPLPLAPAEAPAAPPLVPDEPGAWADNGAEEVPLPALPELLAHGAVAAAPVLQPPPRPAPTTGPFPWLPLLAGLWLLGSGGWFSLAWSRIRRFHGLLGHAEPAPEDVQAEAAGLAARMGLAHCPRVWLVPGVVSPMLWATGRSPRLLVPAGLLERLDGAQRATLLAHELAHLRRGDHWVRALELAVLGLYWWFPLVWWARRELREAEEECCDAWVVWALPESPRVYATALVETLDFLSGARPALPPTASGAGHLHLLRRRLTMIMRGKTPRSLTGLGVLALFGLGVLLLPLMPTWAQPPRPGSSGDSGEEQGDPKRRPADLEKAREELRRMAAELERARDNLNRQREEIERQAQRLQQAAEALRRAEEKPRPKPEPTPKAGPLRSKGGGFGSGFGRPGAGEGGPFGGFGPPFAANLEKRLAEMERKLDEVLREVKNLRREPGKARPGPGGSGSGRPASGGVPFPPNVPRPPLPGAAPGFPGGNPGGLPPGAGNPGYPGGPGGAPPAPAGAPPGELPGGVPGGAPPAPGSGS